jgi:UPF0755 protein
MGTILPAKMQTSAKTLRVECNRKRAVGYRVWAAFLLSVLLVGSSACEHLGEGPEVEVTVPSGASFGVVVDTLQARNLVTRPTFFRAYSRLKGYDTQVRSGRYTFREGDGWMTLLTSLTEGRVVTMAVTVPEGWTLRQIADPISTITGLDPDSIYERIRSRDLHEQWGVPGPGLEGYLFPDTYRFAEGASLDAVIEAMVERYKAVWTPERRALLEETGFDERELVTLASVTQAEARVVDEMPSIASVYDNRVRRSWPLEADPTVLYALGGHRDRLLYAAIDSVADNPYNTYRNPGLPPGPIGAPGEAAIDAALEPASEPYMFFVARPGGRHVFTRSLREHNRAKVQARREWDALQRGTVSEAPSR